MARMDEKGSDVLQIGESGGRMAKELVTGAAQFARLVKEWKKRNGKAQTNCTLLPSEVEQLAARGKLSVREDGALCFFVGESDCTRLYYYQAAEGELPDVSDWPRPVVIDCVFRGDEAAARKKCGVDKWVACGFAPHQRNRRMECAKADFVPPADAAEKNSQFPVVPLLPEDYSEAARLWRGSLDYRSATFFGEEEFARACRKGELLGIRLEAGRLAAVIVTLPRGKTSFMEHLVVDPALRGRGMGRTAFCGGSAYLFEKHGAEKINFWVDETNTHAIKLYERMGYTFDGTVSVQYLLG